LKSQQSLLPDFDEWRKRFKDEEIPKWEISSLEAKLGALPENKLTTPDYSDLQHQRSLCVLLEKLSFHHPCGICTSTCNFRKHEATHLSISKWWFSLHAYDFFKAILSTHTFCTMKLMHWKSDRY
jgi:hypothetical protein